MWKKRGLPGKIAGVAVEGELEDFDLDAFTKEQQSRFVKVVPTTGLTLEDALKAIEILNR